MNCTLCMGKLWLCETCEQPWPCAAGHGVGYPCTACNPCDMAKTPVFLSWSGELSRNVAEQFASCTIED